MIRTDNPGFVVDPSSGAILNNDEQAWLRYKAEREVSLTVQNLQEQVKQLMIRVAQLEERLNEATTIG